jgi:Fe-S-cluster-containing dehydrogenase component
MADTSGFGLMIDYDFCSGCHACEVACKKEHDMPRGDFGIKIVQDGPRQNSNGTWEFDYLPLPTSLCDLCEVRVQAGKLPTCVHHCQAGVMVFGTLAELAAKVEKAGKDKMVIFAK